MNIEYLFPEISGIFGDYANVKIIEKSVPNTNIYYTNLNDTPKFIFDDDIDLVYMGSMTERSQLIVIERLRKYADEISNKIEAGQNFFVTGNAVDVFCKKIVDVGDFQLDEIGSPQVDCLGIFPIEIKRDMINRWSSLWVGDYNGIKLTGLKSQFTTADYVEDIMPLFRTIRGSGMTDSGDTTREGIKYKGFRATYCLGPILIMNPIYLKTLIKEVGYEVDKTFAEDDFCEAYELRLVEYMNPKLKMRF